MRVLLASCVICCGALLSVGSVATEVGEYASHGGGGNFSFSGRVLLYNWGAAGRVPNFDRGFFGGDLFASTRAKGNIKSNLGWNSDCDFSGDVSFEYLSDGGVTYGADFQLMIPEVSDAVEREGKALVNRGSRIYALTPYGKFSVGYQEGVESARDGGFDDFIRGKDPSFMKYRLPLLKGDFYVNGAGQWLLSNSAVLYPGLYSESLFRSNNHLNYYGFDDQSRYYSKYFVNNLPFRISYQSPSFMGMSFGFSYSPSGYSDDLFTAWMPKAVRHISSYPHESHGDAPVALGRRDMPRVKKLAFDEREGVTLLSRGGKKDMVRPANNILAWQRFSYAPAYKNILSSSWSVKKVFSAWGNGIGYGLSLGGEYASAPKGRGIEGVIEPTGGYRDLFSVEVSAYASVRGFALGGSYGYLGRSGYPMGKWENTDFSWELDDMPGGTTEPSYYMVAGVGYSAGPMRVETSYLVSRKGGYLVSVESKDLGARLSYDLYTGDGVSCSLFAQYHRVAARYAFAQGLVGTLGRAVLLGMKVKDGVIVDRLEYNYDLLGFGVKLAF